MPVAVNAGSACCVQGASCSLYPILRHHRPPFTLMVCRVDPSSELTRVDGRLDYPLQGSGCGFDGQSALPPSAVALPRPPHGACVPSAAAAAPRISPHVLRSW